MHEVVAPYDSLDIFWREMDRHDLGTIEIAPHGDGVDRGSSL